MIAVQQVTEAEALAAAARVYADAKVRIETERAMRDAHEPIERWAA